MTATLTVIGRGRVLNHPELVGRSLCYFLTVTFAGRTFRWCFPSARDVWAEEVDGESLHFQGMDYPQMSQSFDFDSDSPVDISVSFEDLTFPGDVNVPELLAQGHRLERCEAELAALPDHPDALWSERQPVLLGEVREPVYGDPETHPNTVGFTVDSPSWEDAALFPPDDWVVTEEAWPDAHESAIGKVFPFVFGQPGYRISTSVKLGSPGIPVVNDRYMFAGHPVAPNTYDETIFVVQAFWNATTGVGYSYSGVPKLTLATNNGFQYTDANFAGESDYTVGDEIWIRSWGNTSASTIGEQLTVGGYPNFTWDGPLITAGDVLYFMLLQSSLKVDRGRCAAAQVLLQGYRVSGYIDERVSPYEWITDNLFPILPIAMSQGPKGVFPIVWRFDAGPNDCVGSFIEGPRWRRVSSVERDDSNVFNKYTLSYGLDGSDFLKKFGIDGAITEGTDTSTTGATYVPNLYARRSYLEHGSIAVDESSDIVTTQETAAQICAWKIRANALAKRTVTYEASAEHAWLEPGDPIMVTDPDLYFDQQVCLVRTKTWDVTSVLYELLILTDPARDVVPVVNNTPAFAQLVMDNMTVLGVWMAPEGVGHNDNITSGLVALEEVSGSGEPDILSSNSSGGNHRFKTDDNPGADFSAVVDMTDHYITEYLGIATALSAKYRCGGIVFKAHTMSPSNDGEIALLSVKGTHASPFNTSDGDRKSAITVTNYDGYATGESPPLASSMPAIESSAAGEGFDNGWGAYTGWLHLQWRTTGAGASSVVTYHSKVGDTFAGIPKANTASGGAGPPAFTSSNDSTDSDGISDKLQIGYAGSYGGATLKIAAVYVGTDDSVSAAALEAIHDGIV